MTTTDSSDQDNSNDSNGGGSGGSGGSGKHDKHGSDRELPRHIATWTGGVADRVGLAALMELVQAYRRARDAARAATAMLADAGIGPDEITAQPVLSYEGRPRVVLRAAPDISENAAVWLRRRDPYFSTEPTQPTQPTQCRSATTNGATARSSPQSSEHGQPRDRGHGATIRDRPNRDTDQSTPRRAWWAA